MNRRRFVLGSAAILATPTGLLLEGCSPSSIAQQVVDWTPSLQSTAATVAATVELLVPEDAVIIKAALVGFDAATNLAVAEAKAYLANPGQTTLQALQTGVTTLQQQVNSALLQAAKIVNPKSQQAVTAALNAVATVINSIFALILSIKGNTLATAAKTAKVIRLRDLPYSDQEQAVTIVAEHYHITRDEASIRVNGGEALIWTAGF
jgi:hypothetical protein